LQRRSTISKSIRINEAIRADQLRVIGPDGDQLGILSRSEALKIAEDAGVDLVEISPNADPPVVKVVDWGKYQYQKMKELQKSRKNAKTVELKQMRMGLKIVRQRPRNQASQDSRISGRRTQGKDSYFLSWARDGPPRPRIRHD